MSISVILHNIRSAHNVGSIFRTADGAGVSRLYLSGHTPTPINRFGYPCSEIEKTSLGATQMVPYETVQDIQVLFNELKKKGTTIIVVEQTDHAVWYKDFSLVGDVAFVFGNEITGIENDVGRCADHHIQIPMRGRKESLNVAVCVGIILFHFQK